MPLIALDQINKNFNGHEVLQAIDLRVKEGEVVALLGPSGAGKSTLLRCINLLEQPCSGQLAIGDEVFTFPSHCDVRRVRRVREKISMVFQHFNLWPHKTVLENITLAPMVVLKKSQQAAKQDAMDLLAQMKLQDKAQAYPHVLSGGQQQRIGIARALAMDPDILLFDEPTGSLDPEKAKDILAIIAELVDLQKTIIVVTHEMQFAEQVAERIIFLEHGRIVVDDSHDAVFEHDRYPRLTQFIKSMHIEGES